ncbi:Alpha/Beta hydrolase protein [Xylariomycetidae sp. FL2044]|nr:Alpha/Beta hydrolase protein [Xylariomycetidae sp. FL2044]
MSPHKTTGDAIDPTASSVLARRDETGKRQWLMGAEAFNARMPHHEGIEPLWETKWKLPCSKSVYPFHDGQFCDFEPIFRDLISRKVDDGTSPAYTRAFLPGAERLEHEGDQALAAGDSRKASELYLRSACVLRIARFPYITAQPAVNDETKWEAWERQKRVYMKAGALWARPVREVPIPHTFRQGRDRDSIPVYIRTPPAAPDASPPQGHPTVLLLTGLDGYRPDNTARCEEFLSRGWAVVVAEIPGTADCPADPADPAAPERLWDSVLAYMTREGVFDMRRILVWGLSSGGYYALRIAHTHAAQIAGAVAQGAGSHWFFDREWLEPADGHEYPFRLLPALALKHGFPGDDEGVEAYKKEALGRFSLLQNGILDQACARLLLVNGTMDGLMPIEDSMLLLEHGSPKECRFLPGALHMGYPMANLSVYPWMEQVMASVK